MHMYRNFLDIKYYRLSNLVCIIIFTLLNNCKENVLNFPTVKLRGVVDLCIIHKRLLASFPDTLNQFDSYAENPISVLLNVIN